MTAAPLSAPRDTPDAYLADPSPAPASLQVTAPPPAVEVPPFTGPATPPGAAATLPAERLLPRRPASTTPALYWVGAHGGAGVTTLTRLIDNTATLGCAWPVTPGGPVPCLLVARTHAAGLQAARDALTDWAGGSLRSTVDLIATLLIADAPGRLPRPLQEPYRMVYVGSPRLRDLPWVEEWRLTNRHDPYAPRPDLSTAPHDVRKFAAQLADLVPALRGGHYPTTGSDT